MTRAAHPAQKEKEEHSNRLYSVPWLEQDKLFEKLVNEDPEKAEILA